MEKSGYNTCNYDQSLVLCSELGYNELFEFMFNPFVFVDKIEMQVSPAEVIRMMSEKQSEILPAPLLDNAINFFEKVCQLYVEEVIDQTSSPKYSFNILRFVGNPRCLECEPWEWETLYNCTELFSSKSEAKKECVDELIKIVKSWKKV